MHLKGKHLGCIVKVAERCNINCTYCYFFHGGNETYKLHSPLMKSSVIEKLGDFLSAGVKDLGVSTVNVGIHGGEPLLQNKNNIVQLCDSLQKKLKGLKSLKFGLQTNGMLIDEEWMDIFTRFNINVGISIDGPKKIHDANRIDHRSKGTYDRVHEKIKYIQNHPKKKSLRFGRIRALSVVNPSFSGREAYRHLVDDLGIYTINFLLPDAHYEALPEHAPEEYARFLCEVFDEWINDNNPNVNIRYFKNLLGLFAGRQSSIYGSGKNSSYILPLLTISSNGDLAPADNFMNLSDNMTYRGYNVCNISLKNYLNTNPFPLIVNSQNTLPRACKNCKWQNICNGGELAHRYSKKNEFDNPSVYCDGLKIIYEEVEKYFMNDVYKEQIK